MKSEDQNAESKWSTIAGKWMYYLPPGRPSQIDIRSIEDVIRSQIGSWEKPFRALVLGATPEYRDMLHRFNASVTVVDKNPDMIAAMGELCLESSSETVYTRDWFEFLPYHQRQFDLILSDFTQGNIEYDRQAELYRLIANALQDDGCFVDRVLTFRDRALSTAADELLEEYSTAPANLLTLNDMMFRLFFTSDEVWQWQVVDVDRMYTQVEQFKGGRTPLRRLACLMREFIFGENIIWYYGKGWSEISQYYFKHLRPSLEIPDTDTVYRGFSYIIVTQAKR